MPRALRRRPGRARPARLAQRPGVNHGPQAQAPRPRPRVREQAPAAPLLHGWPLGLQGGPRTQSCHRTPERTALLLGELLAGRPPEATGNRSRCSSRTPGRRHRGLSAGSGLGASAPHPRCLWPICPLPAAHLPQGLHFWAHGLPLFYVKSLSTPPHRASALATNSELH